MLLKPANQSIEIPKKVDKSASTSADGIAVAFSHAPTEVLLTILKQVEKSMIVNL